MPFLLSEVTSTSDFDALTPLNYLGLSTPHNAFSAFINPIHTTLDAAIETTKARHIAMWKSSPACHWLKVSETSTGEVVGAAFWDVTCIEKGYVEGDGVRFRSEFKATQHVEGSEERLWAEKLNGGLRGAVMERITRPHVELKQIVVHPDFRRQGVAKILTKWGTDIADKRGVEAGVVAVPFARPVYERLGFECVEEIQVDFEVEEPSEKWKAWQREDMRAFLMVRGAKGGDGAG